MFVKVCCISSIEEAEMAIAAGANALGLVGPMPSGPGIIEDDLIREIANAVDGVETFLLTSEISSDGVIEHHRRTGTTTIQLVDTLAPGAVREIRREIPSVKLVQVVHVLSEESVEEAVEVSQQADFLLLDSGNPNLSTKELGGTGRTHNWEISRKIVEKSEKPVILAGGLNPGNVGDAISAVSPFGVDLCSGIRSTKGLDPEKLNAFISNTRR